MIFGIDKASLASLTVFNEQKVSYLEVMIKWFENKKHCLISSRSFSWPNNDLAFVPDLRPLGQKKFIIY
jgi:hypothetical protein